MGFLDDEEILAAAPRRVFLDIDPGFGQMWRALGQHDTFRGHDAYVTIAENIGKPGCAIPDVRAGVGDDAPAGGDGRVAGCG